MNEKQFFDHLNYLFLVDSLSDSNSENSEYFHRSALKDYDYAEDELSEEQWKALSISMTYKYL